MHKVHMHAGAIMQLLYGCAHVREIIHSLKLADYPPVHTHKPYNNLHVYPGFFLLSEFYWTDISRICWYCTNRYRPEF